MEVIRACEKCGQLNRIPAKHLADTGSCGKCHAELPPSSAPIPADGQLFDAIVREAKVPILVDFWADWCGPCRAAAPEVERTAKEMAGQAVVLKVDTDAYPEVAGRFNVRGIPNFVVLSGGRVVMQQAGLVGHEQMNQWLRQASGSSAARTA